MMEGSLITFGIMASYWIDFALFWANTSSAQWRVPIAIQILLALIMIVGVAIVSKNLFARLRSFDALLSCQSRPDGSRSKVAMPKHWLSCQRSKTSLIPDRVFFTPTTASGKLCTWRRCLVQSRMIFV